MLIRSSRFPFHRPPAFNACFTSGKNKTKQNSSVLSEESEKVLWDVPFVINAEIMKVFGFWSQMNLYSDFIHSHFVLDFPSLHQIELSMN